MAEARVALHAPAGYGASLSPEDLSYNAQTSSPAPEMLEAMQPILGTIGFIAGHVRPDAYFAYSILCRHITAARITTCAVRSVIRLGHYLVTTRELCLHLTSLS